MKNKSVKEIKEIVDNLNDRSICRVYRYIK